MNLKANIKSPTSEFELREAFWLKFPRLERRPGKVQEDYPLDVRLTWGAFIGVLRGEDRISVELAAKARL
jgi:hypothetical protein